MPEHVIQGAIAVSNVVFDNVEPQHDFAALPLELTLTTSRSSAALKLMMLTPTMVLLAVPLMLIGARAIAEQSALTMIADNPVSALQIAAGLVVWAALFIWPLKRIIGRMGARRIVQIDGATVAVADSSPFGAEVWTEPLAGYRGIAHHIRASLSGNRHELILVHADPAKNVVVAIADRISQTTIDRAKALLQLPEVPAKDLYVRT